MSYFGGFCVWGRKEIVGKWSGVRSLMAVMLVAVFLAGPVYGAEYLYYSDSPAPLLNAGCELGPGVCPVAGELVELEARFNSETKIFTWKSTYAPSPNDGYLPNGFRLVVNDGPLPDSPGVVAHLWADLTDPNNPILTVYVYNDEYQWEYPSYAKGCVGAQCSTDAPDRVLSSLVDPSFVHELSSVDANGLRIITLTIDASAIINHAPLHTNDGNEWYGLGFDTSFGYWLHTLTGANFSYCENGDASGVCGDVAPGQSSNGFIKSQSHIATGWYDFSNLLAIVVTQCNDGIDNDGDGLIDLDDPDCVDSDGESEGGISLVENVSASKGTNTDGITLSWDAFPGASSYIVYRRAGANSPVGEVLVADIVGTTYFDPNVSAGEIYYYWVSAVVGSAVTLPSLPDFGYLQEIINPPPLSQCEDGIDNDGDGLVDGDDPDCALSGGQSEGGISRVTNVKASKGDDANGIVLSWDAFPGALSYIVYRQVDVNSTAVGPIVASGLPVTGYYDTSVDPDGVYLYWVSAVVGTVTTIPSEPDFGWMQSLSATCKEVNISQQLDIVLSDMFVLRDVTRRALQVLRTSSNDNKRENRFVSNKLRALDFRYEFELNISAVLSPIQVVECANTTYCATVDNTSVKKVNADKAIEMALITRQAIRRTKKFRNLESNDKRRRIRANKTRDELLKTLDTIPDVANSCS